MSLQRESDDGDKRRKLILLGVAGVLALTAAFFFIRSQRGDPPPPQPALQHAEQVQESVQKASPPPQFGATSDDIQRTAPKRSVTPDGK
jgi:hypothetical protein